MKEFLGKKHYTKEENKQLYSDIRMYNQMRLTESGVKRLATLLLDSSLIFPTNEQVYSHKIIECGNYYKVYNYNKRTTKKDKGVEKEKFYNIKKARLVVEETTETNKKEGRAPPKQLKKIELKNIYRSKAEMENLIKANESKFKTFITLTFKDDITDISEANKKFDIWRTKVKSIKRDFVYVCVPEFQKKRGKKTGHYVVHYHLLTNLEINENLEIIIPQKNFSEKQLEEMTEEQRKKCYDVKYWSYGYSSVFNIENINVVGYMSKYMTKDIDNRLWGKRRYLASHNLTKPSTVYLDEKDFMDWVRITSIETSMEKTYENMYANKITGELITFQEFKRIEEL